MQWSYVLVAAVASVGVVAALAIAMAVVVKVPWLRKRTVDALRKALRPADPVVLPNDLPKPVATAPRTEASPAPVAPLTRSVRLGYFVIETDHAERTRLLVEMFLERETKRWRLDGSTGNGNGNGNGRGGKSASGRAMLMYLVRFRKNTQPATVLERLSAVGLPADFTVRLETDSGDAA
jgi:hypothetical protein